MALQIYVYDEVGSKWELDLYEEEPLKLTVSAEDIKEIPKVNSAFSKQFRIPATQNNSKVFKWWYELNTVDFDITKRVSAELFVDGLFYKSGHIRIQAAYVNNQTSNVDLEVVFFGETRDFASQISEKMLPELNLTTLNHELTLDNVEDSWLGLLHNGGVRYIIADRGYTYDDNGNVLEDSQIGFNNVGNNFPKSFSKNNFPININQLTPMIQVKRIIDAIFDMTEYSYSSDSVFNQMWFKQLYTDGIPNASPVIDAKNGTFEALSVGWSVPFFENWYQIKFENEISDPSGSYYPLSGYYFVPEDGNYTFNVGLNLRIGRSFLYPTPTYNIRLRKGTTILDSKSVTVPYGITALELTDTLTFSGALTKSVSPNAADAITVEIKVQNTTHNNTVLKDSIFECVTAPTFIAVSELLKYDVKCIDFLKSILTKFKLVMVPNKDNDYQFIIKPWNEYINSGDQFDWTHKLDNSMDMVLTPVFYEQSQLIDFTDQTDEDHHNRPFTAEHNRVYGALQFDSKNDLLKERRTIDTIFAPTPVCAVEGTVSNSKFIIPYFSKLGDLLQSYGHLEHLPMRVKPRLLFWNGMAAITDISERWHYTDGTTTVENDATYPRMTPYQTLPTSANTLNLNWFRETPLFTSINATDGQSVYEKYWNAYIQQLYSPYSRILTAYFNLDVQDLANISFDDTVFIQNSWWRVIKIYDAPLSEISTVKVDLVKLLDVEVLTNNGDPTPTGGGIDDVVVTGDGGPSGDPGFGWDDNTNYWDDDDRPWDGTLGPISRTYAIKLCDNPGDFFYASYTSILPIAPYSAVKVSHDGGTQCWEVIDITAVTPNTTVLSVYPSCNDCP